MFARAFFPSVTLILALLTAACGGTELPSGPSNTWPLDEEENSVLLSINELRMSKGIPSMSVCKSLSVSASQHADDMRDHSYLSDMGQDGSTVRTRACAAGYAPACGTTIGMAELVASGNATGKDTFLQWQNDATSNPILLNGSLIVAGVGSSLADDGSMLWSLDLGAVADASCQ